MSNEFLMFENCCYQKNKCVHSSTLVNESYCALSPPDRCMSAGQVLEATKMKVTGRMKKALESVALKKEASCEKGIPREKNIPHEKEVKGEGASSAHDGRTAALTVDPLFKGVSPALLERVCLRVSGSCSVHSPSWACAGSGQGSCKGQSQHDPQPTAREGTGDSDEIARILSHPQIVSFLPLLQKHLNQCACMQVSHSPCQHFS